MSGENVKSNPAGASGGPLIGRALHGPARDLFVDSEIRGQSNGEDGDITVNVGRIREARHCAPKAYPTDHQAAGG